jgi:isopentenyl diphosphate isomerase/L-lactate dehydrogenase-like FMN-dependent dehydrogenase
VTTATIDLSAIKTVGDVVARAEEVIDPGLHVWAAAGAGEEATLARNKLALNRLALVPRVLRDVSRVDTSTTFLGVPLALPVMTAPVGALALYHPQDALGSAMGATEAGTSTFCATLLAKARWEDVAATAPGRHFFQLYVLGDRDWLSRVVARAERAGFAGICITVDSPALGRRDRSLQTGFLWSVEREEVPINLKELGVSPEYRRRFTWSDLQFVCQLTSLPVILKGVIHPDDAARAVECGVKAIYVSNHGGRAMDHGISTIEALEQIVRTVVGSAEVVVDSGFTRGADVCKALALGARAVGIGKLQCWALAIGGAAGVARVLEILGREIEATMANLGCSNVGEITRDRVTQAVQV